MGFSRPELVNAHMAGTRWPLITLPEDCPRGGDSRVSCDFQIAPKRRRASVTKQFRVEELFLGAGHPKLIFGGNPKTEVLLAYRRQDYITD